ncbi:MAG TPA: DHA2 family efflux MFS transporter permease subunit [Terriglobales bacterium]|nr:DHA2 family efflux MFS transporter permease subunit [Terriglobales bacterium]
MTDSNSNRLGINPWVIAITVMLSTFLEVLDTSVVNVSLPHIAGSLSATIDEATWVLTSYLVANAIVLPITGWLANQFGRKRLLIAAVSGFTIASFLCGIAPTLPLLVLFRVLQGAAGGALQPISQAILLETFPPEQRGKAMAFWGLGIVVAPILGPTLGGFLTDAYSWRWVFYINLPVGIASIVMTRMFIFDPSYIKPQGGKVDVWGFGMLAVGIAALQIVLDKGQEADWFGSNMIVTLCVVAAAALIAFVVWELTVKDPIVHLRVFKSRTYATGVFLMTLLGFVLYGSLVLLPIFLQTLLGYTAVSAGIWTSPRGVGALIFMPITGVLLTRKWDPRLLLMLGLLTGAWSLYAFSHFNLNSGTWDIFWPQIIQGAGMAFIFVPLTTVTMDPVPNHEMGNATALFNLMRNLGASAGISSVTTLVARRGQFHQNRMLAQLTPQNPGYRSLLSQLQAGFVARGNDATTAAHRALGALYGMLQQQSALLSFVEAFWLLAIIFLLMTPLVLIMRRPKSSKMVTAH